MPKTDPTSLASYDEIGILVPCYMFGLPELVREFIEKMTISPTARLFAIINSGGFPALSLPLLRQALGKAVTQLTYAESVKMPDSYIIGFKVDEEENKLLMIEADKKIDQILSDLELRKTTTYKKTGYDFMKPIQKFVSKIAKNSAKHYVVTGCVGCLQCVKLCPTENITYEGSTVHFHNACIGCLGCINLCPVKAINYGKKTIGKTRYVNRSVDLLKMKSDHR